MDVVTKAVGNELHPNDNINDEKRVATGLPKQENDVDCGAFVLFYADCARNKMKIKPRLAAEEITNYRGVIWGYVKEAPTARNLPSQGDSGEIPDPDGWDVLCLGEDEIDHHHVA